MRQRPRWCAIVRRGTALAASLALAVSFSARADVTGIVVAVGDGDSITVVDASRIQHRIRLASIDAPEIGQPGGSRARESLSQLVYEREVRVEGNKQDRFGRIIGKVWVVPSSCPRCGKTLDAGLAQVTMGEAWWFRRYAKQQSPEDRGRYEFAEQEARGKKAGLWHEPDPVPPWEWREDRRRD